MDQQRRITIRIQDGKIVKLIEDKLPHHLSGFHWVFRNADNSITLDRGEAEQTIAVIGNGDEIVLDVADNHHFRTSEAAQHAATAPDMH
jgi:hypothetical protein